MQTILIQRWVSSAALAFLLTVGNTPAIAQSSGRSDTIVVTGQSSPTSIVGSGPFSSFDDPVINSLGQVAFKATFTSGGDVNGVYVGTTSGVSSIAIQGTSAAGGGTYNGLSDPLLNNVGQVVFSASTSGGPGSGIYIGTSSGVSSIILAGASAPNGGKFFSFSTNLYSINTTPVYEVNDSGVVAFVNGNVYSGTPAGVNSIAISGGNAPGGGKYESIGSIGFNNSGLTVFTSEISLDVYGIYLANASGGSLVTMTGASAPGGGTFTSTFEYTAHEPVVNSSGQTAFFALTSGATAPGRGLYIGTSSMVNSIALAGSSAPGGGVFSDFNSPSINNSGAVAFYASTTGAPGSGLYVGTSSGVKSIALQGGSAPGGGTFSSFSTNPFGPAMIAFNNAGDAAFVSFNGSASNLYIGDGTDSIEAVGYGSSVGGSTVVSVSLADSAGSQGAGYTPLNDLGQIAYEARLANGTSGVFIYTPTLHWRGSGSGLWGTSANWTLGINPASVHDVVIDPSSASTVTGPTSNTTVNSLQVGGGSGTAVLDLQTGVTLAAGKGVTVMASGSITGNGVIAGNVSNSGLFSPGETIGSIQVNGAFLQNTGGVLKMELGGLTPGVGYDSLDVTGGFTLGGTLDVTLSGGFTPAKGETFDLFEGSSETGSFSQINLPTLGSGLGWDTSQLAVNGSITVVPEPGPIALLGGAGLLMLLRRRRVVVVGERPLRIS